MKKVIIGIHGLGNKPPKYLLRKWWKEAMMEGLNSSGIQHRLPRFELVYWADILYDKPLNRWEKDKDSPYFLDEPYIEAPKTISDEKHPIQERLAKCISKYQNYDIMIIAHSMGSIITFDVLNFLIPEARVNTLVTIGSPLGLPVVVSKIAAEQKKKSKGQNIMATPPGVTKNWFNFADISDLVSINYKLADDFRGNERGILPTDFLVNNNFEIDGETNHHKSFGYLRTPEFSKILSDFIADRKLNVAQKILKASQGIVKKIKSNIG